MSDLTVSATFTKNGGDPATGLTLAEINMMLTAQHRSTGLTTVVWDGSQVATKEIDNVGSYIKIYSSADLDTYNYYAAVEYTGVQVLDQNWVTGIASLDNIPVGTAIEFTYTLTDSVTTLPIEGATIDFSTDIAGENVVWSGVTDSFGVVRDIFDNLPRLDSGTYYVWRQRSGYVFSDPDIETVS